MRFAVFTDLHFAHVFDGEWRLDKFLDCAKEKRAEFIIFLGDLCMPVEENRWIVNRIKDTGIPFYSCIGNHDMDGHSLKQVTDFYGLPEYYSFVKQGVKFIVLNTNYMQCEGEFTTYDSKVFRKGIDIYPLVPQQELQWLKGELEDPDQEYIILSHHSLANDFGNRGVVNRKEIQSILARRKVLLCLNGHDHGDDCRVLQGIPYYTLNSISYAWHGMKEIYAYSEEIHRKYPYLKDIMLYKEALHGIVTVENGKVEVQGMDGHYQTVTPEDVGMERWWNDVSIEPRVSGFRNW